MGVTVRTTYVVTAQQVLLCAQMGKSSHVVRHDTDVQFDGCYYGVDGIPVHLRLLRLW